MGDLETPSTTQRPMITGPKMYALLIGEFTRLKSPKCTRCRVPLPFWGPAAGSLSVYWYMQTPEPCALGCGQLLSELWAKLTTDYSIAPPEKERAAWKNGGRAKASSE